MAQVEFKMMQTIDTSVIEMLTESVWSYREYTKDETTRKRFVNMDVLYGLVESSYIEVAYVDDEAVGLLMGKVKGESRFLKRLSYRFKLWWRMVSLLMNRSHAAYGIEAMRAIDRVYKQMLKKSKPFDSEVTLFVMHPKAQGQGVGKQLMNRFLTHIKTKDASNVFLFTDSDCTYQFYDRYGFERLQSKTITFKLPEGKKSLDVYIYQMGLK